MRGKKLEGLVAGWDWYATLVQGIAGLDPADAEAAAAGLPPIDSIDQWAYLSGRTTTPPRTVLPIGTTRDPTDIWASHNDIVVHAVIEDDGERLWKLLVGRESQAIWQGPEYPNATTAVQPPAEKQFGDCGFMTGCLFELRSDPCEHTDVAASHPGVVARLWTRLSSANASVFAPLRPRSRKACEVSLSKYKDPHFEFGWWGPFAEE